MVELRKHFTVEVCRDESDLRFQLLKAARSITSSISEGAGRSTGRDFAHFLDMAVGSTNEVKDRLIEAKDIPLIDDRVFLDLNGRAIVVRKMIVRLRSKVLRRAQWRRDVNTRG